MPRRPDPPRLAAWRLFLEAHARIVESLERDLRAANAVPLGWYDILLQLSEAPAHRLRMSELARVVLLSKSGLTRLVDRMAARSLVTRVPCDDDRRGVFVEMTAAGRDALRAAAPVHLVGIERYFARHLHDDDVSVLRDVLSRVLASASA